MSIFGGATNPLNYAQPQQAIKPETKFKEFPPELKAKLEATYAKINEFHSISKSIQEEAMQFSKTTIEQNASVFREKLDAISGEVDLQLKSVRTFKWDVKEDLESSEYAIRLLKRINAQPGVFHQTPTPLPYYTKLIQKFEENLSELGQQIEKLETFLQTNQKEANYSPDVLKEILNYQRDFFISAAADIAQLDATISEAKNKFLQQRKQFGEESNPFEIADKREKAAQKNLKPPTQPVPQQQPQPQPQPGQPSLFGTPAPSATGGLFGTAAPSTGGLFGTAAPSATGGLFGTTAPSTGGLFGSSTPATGGLFGAQPSAPATGGLFGSQPSAPATGGLFGSSTPATGGLFGAQPSAPATGGLFGAQPTATGGGLFGTPSTGTTLGAPPTGGLFGSTQPSTGTGLFGTTGGTTLGAPSTGGFGTSAFGTGTGTTLGAPSATGGLFGSTGSTGFGGGTSVSFGSK